MEKTAYAVKMVFNIRFWSPEEEGDTLIVSELSRLGRSITEVISIINGSLCWTSASLLKQNLDIKGKHDMQSKVMVTIFSLLAELERDLISVRTKRALAAKRAQGMVLGRPAGSISKSKLDSKLPEIVDLLQRSRPVTVSWQDASRCHRLR